MNISIPTHTFQLILGHSICVSSITQYNALDGAQQNRYNITNTLDQRTHNGSNGLSSKLSYYFF